MTDHINEHKFEFKLPMFPNQTISDNGMPCELKMDGHDMKGVTSLTMRAGSNGFTNVVVEFEASCAVEAAAHLVAHMDLGYIDPQEALGGIYDSAIEDFPILREYKLDGCDKAEIVKRIIELTLERFKREPRS